MLRKTIAALLVTAFAGSAGLEYAAAAMPAGNVPIPTESYTKVQPVVWVYIPSKHGARWHYRHGPYVYFYNGWWYSRPWWTLGPGPGAGVWVYNAHKHGARWRYRHGPYTYYYNGWWYSRPWWTIGVPGVNLCIGC